MLHRVFITGATGYLGSAIAARLRRAGHEVAGLTRDPARADALAAHGITPVAGDLADPGSFLAVLKNCDVAIHAAIEPGPKADERDQRALEAIRAAASDGRLRRVLYTSGVWVHGDTAGQVVDETGALHPAGRATWRAAHEEVVLDLAEQEVEAVILRPGIVYGEARGIVGGMFAEAAKRGTVSIPGEGVQTWCIVHRDDVAEAYALALEHARAGERFLVVDESVFTARQIGEAIAAASGATAQLWPAEDVRRQFGADGEARLMSQRATAAKARRDLGWVPRHTSFVNEARDLWREWQSQQASVA